jgi:hypothetical protein
MDPRLRFVALVLLASCFVKGDILHFNTEYATNCTKIEERSCCNLLDSKFWIENKSPVDGDEIILNAAAENLCFNLQHPLNLSSVQTNVSKVTIIVEETLSIDNLTGQEVLMNITSGSVTFSPDLVLSIQGKISMGYIHVKSFELQYDSMLTVQNLTVDEDFVSDSATTIHCNYLFAGNNRLSQKGVLQCGTIVSSNAVVWIAGSVKADAINSTTYFHIEEGGEVTVNTIYLRALSVHGTITSTNSICVLHGPYVSGVISVPTLYLAPTASLYGTGTVNGSVVSSGRIGPTFAVEDPPVSSYQLTIMGDLSASDNEIHISIRSTTAYFVQSKLVVHGKVVLANMTISAEFSTGYEIQPFTCVILECGSVVGEPLLEPNIRARLDISQNSTALILSGSDWYIKPPSDEPLGSVAPTNDGADDLYYWKIAAIALACIAGVLLIIIVVMLVSRKMAKKEHQYDLIVE